MTRCRAILLGILALLPLAGWPAAEMPRLEDYTLLWWAEGPPRFLGSGTPPAAETLCIQSGSWGVAFDTRHVRALRAGRLPATMAIAAATQPGRSALADLPAATWDCAVVVAGHRFSCIGRQEPKDEFLQPVRFIESGRFLQRVVIEGLIFADAQGVRLAGNARLQISAWPDRLAFCLEVEPQELTAEGTVDLRLNDRRATARLTAKAAVQLETFADAAAPRPQVEADPALKVECDETLACHRIALPEKPWSNAKGTYYPEEHLDRLDRWQITLRNDSDRECVARLRFTQKNHLPITGFTAMLCDPDGTPTGLPVQISKNWHQRHEKGSLPEEGPWFHGSAFVRLAPKSTRPLLFQMVYARYGGVFAASHAQLCLIGWGHNQFWDEAAIGSFGESICFEPGRVQRRCFIDDVRPLMTLPQGKPAAKPWGWADNAGGGDFLMWQDAQGRYQPMRATRTDYRAYGPCLTHVGYSEESAGGELAARMTVSLPRSDDYLRTFIHLRYDVLRPLRWRRLAFFQLGADFYNETPARQVAVGDINGLREAWTPRLARDVVDRAAMPLTGEQPWLSIHGLDRAALQPGRAAASRGLIVRSWQARLGGQPAPLPHATFFCTEWGKGNHRTGIELAPPPGIADLRPGDFVEADLELVVFPADATAYYGPNQPFKTALAQAADTWRLVQREAAGNAIKVQTPRQPAAQSQPPPLLFAVDANQRASATLTGGLGHVPITFTGLSQSRGYRLFVDDQLVDQSLHGNDFWQTDYDPATRTWQLTFNLPITDKQPHTLRLGKAAETK
jgi:hypothetical protein